MKKELSVYMKPFVLLAGLLIRLLDKRKKVRGTSFQVAKELQVLYPDMERKQAELMFREMRLAYVLLVVIVGLLLVATIAVSSEERTVKISAGGIKRGNYDEADQLISLQVDYESGKREQVNLAVGAKEYTSEALEGILAEFCERLPGLILGENASLDKITDDLLLNESYEGYPFIISWYCRAGEYISDTGELICKPSQSVQTCLEPVIMYGNLQWEQVIYITILPGEIEEEEALRQYLLESEAQSRRESLWILPKEWQGEELTYRVIKKNYWGMGLLLVALIGMIVFFLADRDLHDRYVQRQKRLREEYAELLHRIVLYMGAGMTIRGSLNQISREYISKKVQDSREVIAFEELGYVCREIRTGVPEAEAYERFGQRTGLQEYIQLSTLLIQNLQKGSNALTERLREEAGKAQREYLQHCKKAGEEAQTKLLLPMVMMLVVVMLMILVPAFHSAGV